MREKQTGTQLFRCWGGCLVGFLAMVGAAFAAPLPTPPCGTTPVPAYTAPGTSPSVVTGPGSGLPAALKTQSCVYWDARDMSLVVMLAGSFADRAGAKDILARFGAISRRAGMAWWSDADKKSEQMIAAASAVTDSGAETHRSDFSVAELADGAPHYFVQEEDASTGEVIYALRARELTAGRLVLTVENVSPIKNYFIRLFDPGDLRTTYYLDRLHPGIWGYYSLSGVQESPTTGAQDKTAATQAIAMFRLIAGMGR